MSKQPKPKPLATSEGLRKFLQDLEETQRVEQLLSNEDMAELLTTEFLQRLGLQ